MFPRALAGVYAHRISPMITQCSLKRLSPWQNHVNICMNSSFTSHIRFQLQEPTLMIPHEHNDTFMESSAKCWLRVLEPLQLIFPKRIPAPPKPNELTPVFLPTWQVMARNHFPGAAGAWALMVLRNPPFHGVAQIRTIPGQCRS